MHRSLWLVDDDGDLILYLPETDVSSLSLELYYTIDHRPSEYPEYAELKDALDRWLSA